MAEENIKNFELDVVSDKKTGLIAIKDKENLWEVVKELVNRTPAFVIEDKEGLKRAKGWHADINAIIKGIDRKRIDTVEDFTSDFTNDCNELKNFLVQHLAQIKEEIKAYEDKQKAVVGTNTVSKFTAILKFTDAKLIDKLTKFAQTNGCELTIK